MSRIPKKLSLFDNYITAVTNHLLATPPGGSESNGVRLGLSDTTNPPPPSPAQIPGGELGRLQAFNLLWRNPSEDGIYQRHSNIKTKTKVSTGEVKTFFKDFKKFFQPLLMRMSGSANITTKDRVILNIAEPRTGRTRHKKQIEELPFAVVERMGGGMIKFRVSISNEVRRCGIPKGAQAIQIVFGISDNATPMELDYTPQITSTRAILVHNFGLNSVRQFLNFRLRYINFSKPDQPGGWTGAQVVLIA